LNQHENLDPLEGPNLEVIRLDHPTLLVLIPRNREEDKFVEETCEVIKDLEFEMMGW